MTVSKNPGSNSSSSSSTRPSKPVSKTTTAYLLLYNALSFALWTTITVRLISLLTLLTPTDNVAHIFDTLFPLLHFAQSLALLEILHSAVGLVRASVVTTTLQVASRILVVWGVLYLFSVERIGRQKGVVGAGNAAGANDVTKLGDWAFVGCVAAWGVTECIRYGFFTLQFCGAAVPRWVIWLRYNTFFILYPIGISSECCLIYKVITPAGDIHPALAWFFISTLVIYVPGSYILYTHMMSQRRKVIRAAKQAD
ncbi:hypothetical protein PAAG_08221 [Paracoccidioides lutzii Pb01]|uniref:Very-long-chain (3R)-3-hydroxyacyl-CoA dehydratase n=1 Tax=Paracoccidioides lutzii (strain ATCC MYA-826 / Pb01) TaxID=502779 RepID=C1HBT0_PARBA|nr:hypothetical protein PAAG_08221 [Paracoccidioides lutzii Pb01]EEH38494.2 hypothetical protein PAAG_08221 [Paracoccidioides lutzii Pb01]